MTTHADSCGIHIDGACTCRTMTKETTPKSANTMTHEELTGLCDALRPQALKELATKLRYMGKQYSAGQEARGGGRQKHYLEEAADQLDALFAAKIEYGQEIADLRNVVQAACIDGMPGMARAWEKYFPDHPITINNTPAGSAAAVPQAERLSKLALMLENGYPPKAAASQLRDMAAASQQVEAAPKEFERWLRRARFQKPTPEAYDLAKCAWQEASRPPADTQDAERLDWLQANRNWSIRWKLRSGTTLVWAMLDDGEAWGHWHPSIRAAIDAARQEGKGGAL